MVNHDRLQNMKLLTQTKTSFNTVFIQNKYNIDEWVLLSINGRLIPSPTAAQSDITHV